MSPYTVNVSGISPNTTDEKLNEFFTFCGTITESHHTGTTATIQFEKPAAARTAAMLSGGTLDGATLTVTSDDVHLNDDHASRDGPAIDQSDKPRAGIAAEYLAKGYILSDHILERAIDLDRNQGISKRFLDYVHSLDTSLGARALGPDQTISGKLQATASAAASQAKSMDEKKEISKTAQDYYSKALSSPLGQKVRDFYTSTSKQVQDIQEEARRIAAEQKAAATPATSSDASAPAGATDGSASVPEAKPQAAPTVV